jgi:Tfp pilus assembly protein PilW
MTITTRSPIQPRNRAKGRRAFTLVEVMIGASLGSFILAAVLSSFLFLGRSGANLINYTEMETQARKALEYFAEDTRQASAVTWTSSTAVTMIVNSQSIYYTYSSGTFTRRVEEPVGTVISTMTLLTGVQEPTTANPFFRAYNINGTQITDFSTATARTTANNTTKQIQISLSASRSNTTVTTATNIVLSARYVLRNKRITV